MFAVLLMSVLNVASVNVSTEEELLNAAKSDGLICLNDNITLTKVLEFKGSMGWCFIWCWCWYL